MKFETRNSFITHLLRSGSNKPIPKNKQENQDGNHDNCCPMYPVFDYGIIKYVATLLYRVVLTTVST